METLEVPLSQNFLSEEEDSDRWGRLLPIRSCFRPIELSSKEVKFGRDDQCDYSFCDVEDDKQKLLAYSKIHFILVRQELSTGTHTFLHDKSSNGTFINGTKVGKNMKQVLNNNDEISLVSDKNKAFIYIDLDAKNSDRFPADIVDNYTVCKVLGRGACGEVRIVFDKNDKCQAYAMKIIPKKKFSCGGTVIKDSSASVENEVKIMQNLNHPCIVNIHNVKDCADHLFIILELVKGGELFDRIVNDKQLKESTAKLMFYQMVLAVQYLHGQGIAHRDLKAENILLMTDEEETLVKVTDFGLSKLVNSATIMQTFCGTPTYVAPEVLKSAGKGSYTNAIDLWSLGVILFVCLGGYPPFSDDYKGRGTLANQIINGQFSFTERWHNVSDDAKDLVEKLLCVDPKKRIGLDGVLEHRWMKDDEMRYKASILMNKQKIDSPVYQVVTKRVLSEYQELETSPEKRRKL